jgi:hypothetical protein
MWLEQKYIGLMSNRLEMFKRKKQDTYNFRCPSCGDSLKDKHKARGWIFPNTKTSGFLYHCHNCSITLSIEKLIEMVDPLLYQEFIRERLVEFGQPKKRIKSDAEILALKMKTPEFVKQSPLFKLKKISQLSHHDPVKQYIMSRKIPSNAHHRMFYAPKFKEWVMNIDENLMAKSSGKDQPRIVLPFIDEGGSFFGFQGRSIGDSKSLRYITIMLDKTKPKAFGLNECDRSKTHFILEGPIDSLFIDNSIAMSGASINYDLVNENSVFVFDNEPRSKETCQRMERVIDKGYKVVIFPHTLRSKDINDMVLNKEVEYPNELLQCNISSGLEAKIIFTAWRKV